MFGYEGAYCSSGGWWIFCIFMIGMMVFCIFMMRGRMGSMMCGSLYRGTKDADLAATTESAKEILEKRLALGEIDMEEFEKKKRALDQ